MSAVRSDAHARRRTSIASTPLEQHRRASAWRPDRHRLRSDGSGSADEGGRAMAGKIYALVVGIDAYQAVTPLHGCKNDALRMVDVLQGRAAGRPIDVATLFDGEATRQGLIDAFRRHLGQAGDGDLAVFTYAGH